MVKIVRQNAGEGRRCETYSVMSTPSSYSWPGLIGLGPKHALIRTYTIVLITS